ncbi:hypothetical protein RJT34_15384 [Clitoria ternatea]|uniref:Uncharacterized protein n=1 Tax=Clitoria ternatea TaxID=43366 RepID=A0AAN9PBD3_CLITE
MLYFYSCGGREDEPPTLKVTLETRRRKKFTFFTGCSFWSLCRISFLIGVSFSKRHPLRFYSQISHKVSFLASGKKVVFWNLGKWV